MKFFLTIFIFAVTLSIASHPAPFYSPMNYSDDMLSPYQNEVAWYQNMVYIYESELSAIHSHSANPDAEKRKRISYLEGRILRLQQLIEEEETNISMLQTIILYDTIRTP